MSRIILPNCGTSLVHGPLGDSATLVPGGMNGTKPSGFTPLSLGATLIHWWNVTMTGDPVSSWQDDIQPGATWNMAQATGANQPSLGTINGHNAISLGASNSSKKMTVASGAVLFTVAGTIWAVIRCPSGGLAQWAPILSQAWAANVSTHLGGSWVAGGGKVGFWAADSSKEAISNVALDDNALHTLIGTFDKSASPSTKLYVDGVLQTITSTTASTASADGGAQIGEVSASPYLSGTIGNIGVCDTALSTANVALLSTYLATWAGI